MIDNQETNFVRATLVPENQRLAFLPSYFGSRLMLRGEALVYAWLRRLSKDYNGGYWNYYTLSNGGFYMAPEQTEPLNLVVDGNGFNGYVSADAAGIVSTLFAIGQLTAEAEGMDLADALIDRYYFLKEFVGNHVEANLIFSAID